MQLESDISLQSDVEMIFQVDDSAWWVVVHKFELYVPKFRCTSEGEKCATENCLKPVERTYLEESINTSPSQRDTSGDWRLSAGVKNPLHVIFLFQQTRGNNSVGHNPYQFDTFNIDGDNSAKLSTCRFQYGADLYPSIEYEEEFKERIFHDMIDFRYRANNYDSGVQLQTANFTNLYPIIYFDLRNLRA